MKSYLIPQFLILNNDTNKAVVQNKNGINYQQYFWNDFFL